MSEASDDELLDSFQEWQLGIFLLIVVVIAGSIAATVLQTLAIPFGTEIGVIGGTVLTFLAISYWYYGR